MRIIHTADWHLCDKLGRLKRYDDFKQRVDRVAELCQEREVDLLLIAGDLFSEQAQVEDMTKALRDMHESFGAFFGRGGTILAITGNHDRDQRINIIRAGMDMARPTPANGTLDPGRMYVENSLRLVSHESANGDRAQFVLVPYPMVSRYAEASDQYTTKEEENKLFQGRIADWIRDVPSRPHFDSQLPTVLVGHLHVRGSEVHSLYGLEEKDDIVFDAGFIPSAWSYVALGHIHKGQALNGMKHVRYSGSLDRCDFGEIDQPKAVVLFELDSNGLKGEPACLPIPSTPLLHLDVDNPDDDLPLLEQKYPDRDNAIVRVHATHVPGGSSREEITRELRRLFPRLYELTWTEKPDPNAEAAPAAINPRGNLRQVIADFLAGQLKEDPDREDLLALLEPYVAVEEQR